MSGILFKMEDSEISDIEEISSFFFDNYNSGVYDTVEKSVKGKFSGILTMNLMVRSVFVDHENVDDSDTVKNSAKH